MVSTFSSRCEQRRLTVDEDVEVVLLFADLLDKLLDLALLGDIGNKRNNLAGDVLAVSLLDSLELLLGASNNVDLGSIGSEGLSGLNKLDEAMPQRQCWNIYHQTNAGASSSDKSNLALDVEDLGELKVVVGHVW